MSDVRCYAGSRYPERPVAFEWKGDWLDVAEVRRSTRTAEGLVFDVCVQGGQCYRLAWDQTADAWTITAVAKKQV